MRARAVFGWIAAIVILGCGGANTPYVPNGTGTGGGGGVSNFGMAGGGTQTVAPGEAATFNVLVSLGVIEGRSPLNVTLTAQGLPANATPSFSVNPVTPTNPAAQSVLTVSTTADVLPGNYPFTIRGFDGVNARTVASTLIVTNPAPGFVISIEALDATITTEAGYPTDDPSANYRVNITAPQGYQGNARLEWRFTDQNAPTEADILGVWHYGLEQSGGTLEYTIGPSNLMDSAECTLQRQRNMTINGNYALEFRVVPLSGAFAAQTATSTLEVRVPDGGPSKPKK
jgi:hypothetical protein